MGCDNFQEISFAEFGGPFNLKVLRDRIPVDGTLELTHRCNLKCVHCYCNQTQDELEIKQKELSLENIYKLLDHIARRGCLWLLFTGGEPLVREDFKDIYIYAKKKGFLITIFTNATLITPEIADLFKEYPPRRIEVTVYGSNAEIHEKITGISGSFDQCMQGLELLKEKNIKFDLKTMLMSLNKNDLNCIKKISDNFSAKFRFDCLLHRRIDGKSYPEAFKLRPKEIVDLEMADITRRCLLVYFV